jgi:type VI protein secretion system component VasF
VHPLASDLPHHDTALLKFLGWLTQLAGHLHTWRHTAPAAAWAERLAATVDDLLHSAVNDDHAAALRRVLGELAGVTATTPLDVGTVLDWLQPQLDNATSLRTAMGGEILFGRLDQLHGLPCRVLAILANARRIIDLTARGPLQRDPDRILLPWRQSLDATEAALADATSHALTTRLSSLRDLAQRLAARRPDRVLAERTAALAMAAERLHARAASLLDQRRAALQQRAALLRTLGPDSVLSRGFTCTLDATGRVVRDATALQPGDSFQTRFRRGRITGTVVSVDKDSPQAKS